MGQPAGDDQEQSGGSVVAAGEDAVRSYTLLSLSYPAQHHVGGGGIGAMMPRRLNTPAVMQSTLTFVMETLKEMKKNKKAALLALIAMIALSFAGCGGGAGTSSSPSTTPNQPPHTSSGHPTGMWTTLPGTMPINPVHAALLHT